MISNCKAEPLYLRSPNKETKRRSHYNRNTPRASRKLASDRQLSLFKQLKIKHLC
ncbi:MAG: hypothetical protein KME60_31010 [Cyanomargarita calcarea GSE-NOS-MK-12-04C]|uniref:Uncharacterized protein n=1 Tax=Cyanomargarita calcarea GSE-NOS-MK-12-04C TaxID=2839659 RepID=A0A951QTA8_9CYAN|nr:hypothetical protein [Cyanomargarita calcarea GSE-NOS-MK-12-04C]